MLDLELEVMRGWGSIPTRGNILSLDFFYFYTVKPLMPILEFSYSLWKTRLINHGCFLYYRSQRSWAKVMFLQASVILSTGGCLPQCMLGCQPPRPGRHPPDQADTPPDQADTPQTRQTPSPGSRRQHTVNERPVRILLECILVLRYFKPCAIIN